MQLNRDFFAQSSWVFFYMDEKLKNIKKLNVSKPLLLDCKQTVKDFSLYKRLLDQGLMVTLSPDDPNKLNDKNMTDNIVFVLRNCNFTLRDVYNCCLRSIDYALIESDARRVEMEICFQSQFREWAISYQQDVSPKIERPHDFYTFHLLKHKRLLIS